MLMERNITAGIATMPGASPKVPARGAAWIADRKISAETLGLLNAAFGTAFFPDVSAKHEALFFRFGDGWKARSVEGKHFVASKGFKLAFWNLERVLASNTDDVFITEGEMDACALVEAGVPPDQVLSVPNGAKERPSDAPQELRGYDYVKDALKAGLSRKKRFIWCGDIDGPGLSLRADMARILGAARFWTVNWPDGCKDANEYLKSDGAEALLELVTDGALPTAVPGLYRLSELPEPPPLTLWHPGFHEWESKVRLAPRTLSVVTGHPGHGKTMLWGQIWYQIAKEYNIKVAIASFETRPKPHLRRLLRTLHIGKLERDMSPEDMAKADAWINEHYLFIVHPDQSPTLDWFLNVSEVAVIRHGVRAISVDPWNRLEDQRGKDESKTEYIGRCLKTMHAFAHDMNVHTQILAHPAKMEGARRGTAPSLEDISDSKHWDNMVDQGFVVHRPEVFDGTNRKTEAVLYHRKARFEELGHPCKLNLNFDIARGRYVSTDYEAGY